MVFSTDKSLEQLEEEIIYPESDGKPMADGDKQWKCIVYVKHGFDVVYKDVDLTYITGDTFWYPVKGKPSINQAPDTMIVLGRPKGDRGSYKQWVEDDKPPQIVFEIWSPSNNQPEMDEKRAFYERYGVQEYYEFDPERLKLKGWLRQGNFLVPIANMQGWLSPLSKVRFELHPEDADNALKLFEPNGKPFRTHLELVNQLDQAELARYEAEEARFRAEEARYEAEQALFQAEEARLQEQQARLEAENRASSAEQQLQAILAKLKAQGIGLPE